MRMDPVSNASVMKERSSGSADKKDTERAVEQDRRRLP